MRLRRLLAKLVVVDRAEPLPIDLVLLWDALGNGNDELTAACVALLQATVARTASGNERTKLVADLAGQYLALTPAGTSERSVWTKMILQNVGSMSYAMVDRYVCPVEIYEQTRQAFLIAGCRRLANICELRVDRYAASFMSKSQPLKTIMCARFERCRLDRESAPCDAAAGSPVRVLGF